MYIREKMENLPYSEAFIFDGAKVVDPKELAQAWSRAFGEQLSLRERFAYYASEMHAMFKPLLRELWQGKGGRPSPLRSSFRGQVEDYSVFDTKGQRYLVGEVFNDHRFRSLFTPVRAELVEKLYSTALSAFNACADHSAKKLLKPAILD